MTTTTMHFGPEWMRTKQGSSRPAPSPPLIGSLAPPGNSTYSALVTPATNPPSEGRDVAHPFRYSKEEMLRIYKEGGGRGGLGLEVERWEGIVREVGYDPVGLKEISDTEKKLFAGSLNSEARRRQSTSDFLSPLTTSGLGERPKLNHASSAASPMRERIGTFMGRRRGDSTDQAPLNLPRKLSLSNMQGANASPREPAMPSPRVRPGFDGVLSDTWSRRRTSEGASKTAGKSDKESDSDTRGPNIKEEEEDPFEHSRESSGGTSGSDRKLDGDAGGVNGTTTADAVSRQVENMSVTERVERAPAIAAKQSPPGLGDLSQIDWSYLDPQGQTQGPFPAETMQRWYNEGYFQPSLPMKRTHLDTEWTPVGELVRRAGDQPVFLSPLVHAVVPPPGLSRPPENGVDVVPERNQHSPYQPVPTRSLRSSTLDSYLQNGSSTPESPSSSFSGARFVNDSPDPGAFDSRIGGQSGFGTESRMPFATPGAGAVGTTQRRATITDAAESHVNSSFGAGRVPAENGLGFGGAENTTLFTGPINGSPFTQRALQNPGHMNGFAGSSTFNDSEYGSIGGMHSNQGTPTRVLNRDAFGRTPMNENPGMGGSFSHNSSPFVAHAQVSYPQTPLSQYAGQDNRSLQAITPISDRQGILSAQQLQQSYSHSPSYPTTPQSPWASQDGPTFRRPGPFDVNHPTTNNVYVAPLITHSQSFNRPPQPSEQSPWRGAHPPNDAWVAPAASLTIANLGQHNEQQRQAELQRQVVTVPDTSEALPVLPVVAEPQTLPAPSTVAAVPSSSDIVAPQKTRRKSGGQTPQVALPTPKVPPAPVAPMKPPSPAPPVEPKAPWAVEEDKKGKASGTPLNLREIQEAEAKKTGARKAAERERERASRANVQSEESQSFTTSWGLPTSQAGGRVGAVVKETPAASPFTSSTSSPSPSAPAVWTNAAKAPAAKKTMKEIQEEEERRKQTEKKETVAAAARRAYADSTTKAATPQTGGAWSTVGANGKAGTAAVAAVRPAANPTASTKTVPAVPVVVAASSTPVSRPAVVAQVVRPPVVIKSTPSKEEPAGTPGPSLEFLKWMSDSLKGLNNSVNLEELTSMLLSFPLDPDSSTVEIISDLIYASSTTLDGRRFASDFVARRKTDVASRPKGIPATGASKQVSIADVVKSQPKPAQNEWGGFKVVNKKKKGTRS